MRRATFLATAALPAMLILAPMALAHQGSIFEPTGTSSASASGVAIADGGGLGLLLPAVALLLGSGILTYAILRRT